MGRSAPDFWVVNQTDVPLVSAILIIIIFSLRLELKAGAVSLLLLSVIFLWEPVQPPVSVPMLSALLLPKLSQQRRILGDNVRLSLYYR